MWMINLCAPMVPSDSSFQLNRIIQFSLLLVQFCFVAILVLRRRISQESKSGSGHIGCVEGEQAARLGHLGIGVGMSIMYCPYVVQSGVVLLYVVTSICGRISCEGLKNWLMAGLYDFILGGKVALVLLFTSVVMEISMTRFDQATGHCFQQDYVSFL